MSSPPIWSIGTSKRETGLKSDIYSTPGPGSYDFDSIKRTKNPSWKIGTAPRSKEVKHENPGPASYESPAKMNRRWPTYVFGVKSTVADKEVTPGPGSYNLKTSSASHKRGPSYSMRLKGNMSFSRTESPGPGAYEKSSEVLNRRHATYKIGTAKRNPLHGTRESPGPGHYFAQLNSSWSSSTGFQHKFGTAERSFVDPAGKPQPGPGSYNLNRTFDTNSGGVSILNKRRESDLLESSALPGPGSYDPSLLLKKKAPAYRLGSAPRSQLIKDQAFGPGPGDYEAKQLRNSVKARIGTSLRRSLADRTEIPGPGSYDTIASLHSGPSHVIIPKRDDSSQKQKDRDTPGPGAYTPNVETVKSRKPRTRIGSAARDPNASYEGGPGPGSYDSFLNNSLPGWTFGTEQRGRSSNQSPEPGPGSYNLPTKFADIPSYAMTGSHTKTSYY